MTCNVEVVAWIAEDMYLVVWRDGMITEEETVRKINGVGMKGRLSLKMEEQCLNTWEREEKRMRVVVCANLKCKAKTTSE